MQLWISKNCEVPLREQLITQIMLGIASAELKPRQKLPSTRELARRLHVHPNTVNAAYRDLAERDWVEFRKGSGGYVRERTADVALEGRLRTGPTDRGVFKNCARERLFAVRDSAACEALDGIPGARPAAQRFIFCVFLRLDPEPE